jgi:TRAP-type C4-dicarboxylate transport system substrate-binding protein
MNRKGFVTTLFIALVAIAMAAPSYAARELRLGHPLPPTSAQHQWNLDFAKHLKELTSGELEVQVIGGGVLGNPKQQIAQLRAGKLDLWFFDISGLLLAKETREFSVLFTPFLFRDQGHYRRFLESTVFNEMMAGAQKKLEIVYLGSIGDRTPRGIFTTKKAVRVPADLGGLRMRTPGAPFIAEVWKAWGASPTKVRGSEIYQALVSGMVEGDDNGIATQLERGTIEVLKFYTPIHYVHSGVALFMSAKTWATLTPKQQEAAREAVRRVDKAHEPFEKVMEDYLARARKQGLNVVEADLAAFQRSAEAVTVKFDGKFWPEGLRSRIQSIQ